MQKFYFLGLLWLLSITTPCLAQVGVEIGIDPPRPMPRSCEPEYDYTERISDLIEECQTRGHIRAGATCSVYRANARRNLDWVFFLDRPAFERYRSAVDELVSCGKRKASLSTVASAVLYAQKHNFSAQCHILACWDELTFVGSSYIEELWLANRLPYPTKN
jgi:hypothetical protein